MCISCRRLYHLMCATRSLYTVDAGRCRATADTHHRSEWRTPPLSLLSTVHANAEHSLGPRQCETVRGPKGVDAMRGRFSALAAQRALHRATAIRQRRDGRKIVPWYRCRDDRLPQKAANSSASWNSGGRRPKLSPTKSSRPTLGKHTLMKEVGKDPGPIAVCGISVRIHTRFTPPEFVRSM